MTDVDLLEAYLVGDAELSKEAFDEMLMCWEASLPYTDDWITHGYKSASDWYEANKESLALLEKEGELIRQVKCKMKEQNEA